VYVARVIYEWRRYRIVSISCEDQVCAFPNHLTIPELAFMNQYSNRMPPGALPKEVTLPPISLSPRPRLPQNLPPQLPHPLIKLLPPPPPPPESLNVPVVRPAALHKDIPSRQVPFCSSLCPSKGSAAGPSSPACAAEICSLETPDWRAWGFEMM
jgi:hypothetical protein